MALQDALIELRRHWDDVAARFGAEDVVSLREAVAAAEGGPGTAGPGHPAGRPPDNPPDRVVPLLLKLPAGHPVRLALVGRSTRLRRAAAASWPSLDDLGPAAAPNPQPVPAAAPARPSAPWAPDIRARLGSTAAYSPDELRAMGGDPDAAGLLRLPVAGGEPRLPVFQFDGAGQALGVVVRVNGLLGADHDPWGVADWWLSANAWLGAVPADQVGVNTAAEARLLAVAADLLAED